MIPQQTVKMFKLLFTEYNNRWQCVYKATHITYLSDVAIIDDRFYSARINVSFEKIFAWKHYRAHFVQIVRFIRTKRVLNLNKFSDNHVPFKCITLRKTPKARFYTIRIMTCKTNRYNHQTENRWNHGYRYTLEWNDCCSHNRHCWNILITA